MLYPLKFDQVYTENVWGGCLLKEFYGRDIPYDHTGESWDIACHSHGMSRVKDGPLKGMTLETLFDEYKDDLIGSIADRYDKFPLLVKIIDANNRLSLQVHPDDAYAKVHEEGELGKSEMWYVLNAKDGAKVTLGLKDGVTRKQFKTGLDEGDIYDLINEIPVKAGDVINIPAGLIHSIEEDILLAEVEENSDTVYRVFDWNRMGLDGKPRQLHIDKALEVIDFDGKFLKETTPGLVDDQKGRSLIHYIYNQYFAVDKIILKRNFEDSTEFDHMMIYLCIEGRVEFLWNGTSTSLKAGESILIPACLGSYEIVGRGELLRTYIPTPETDKKNPLSS